MIKSKSHYNAIKFYADALAEIKPYLGETSYTFIDDQKVDLGSSIFLEIADFLSSMEIYYPDNEIHVKRGVELDAELLSFQIRDKNKNPISNIPFRISFTGAGLLRNIETSGSDGKIICAIRRISSSRNVETLSLTMDMQTFSRISSDPVIRNIIRSMPAPEKTIRVIMDKPSIFVSTHEKVLNNISNNNALLNSLKGNLGKDFTVIDNKENADYSIDLESNTSEKGTYINEHYVTMKCSIIMRDNNGNILLRRTIEDDHMGNNFESASRIAYQNTARTIERSIIRDIVNSIN